MPGLVPVSTTRTTPPAQNAPAHVRQPLVQTAPPSAVPSAVNTAVQSAVPSGVPSPVPTPNPQPAASQPAPPAQAVQPPQPPAAQRAPSQPAQPPQPPAQPAPSFAPPSNPHSTAAGAGLSLLRTLAGLSPQDAFAYLRHYTPAVISKVMDGLLDPDALGLILRALQAGAGSGNDDWIKQVIAGLKSNRRWRMTELMLPKAEREALARLS